MAGAYNGTMEVPLSTPGSVPPSNLTQEIEDPLRSSTERLSLGNWSARAGPYSQPEHLGQDPVTPRRTGGATLQASQRPQNPVCTPSTLEDSTPGSRRRKRQPARLSQSSAPADARKFSSRKAHAKKEAHRRGRLSEIMDKLESIVVVHCKFKESQKGITKEDILNASYDLLRDWESDKKDWEGGKRKKQELAEIIQELERKNQELERRVHDLGGKDLGWNKEAPLLCEDAQGGRMPSPPSSNQTSPVRGPHHQSSSGGIGTYQANRFR